jgi:hypothetical protein
METTCALQRRKLSQVSFSDTGWPRLEGLDVAQEFDMALVVLGSDYHVRNTGITHLSGL